MIGIRVDGNAQIGTGHVMRCLAIAREMKELGAAPVFFCAQENEAIEKKGFACVAVGGVYDDLSKEDLSPFLREYDIDRLLVDTYFADAAYFERLPCKTACLFDLGDPETPCDLLIDYNINYGDFSFPRAKHTLLGPKYAPLRREFRGCAGRDTARVHTVLLTTGGTDETGVTKKIISRLCADPAFETLEFSVVVGGLNKWKQEIRQTASQYKNVMLHEDAEDMAVLMKKADIALSAGGTTLYELCACALPCVAFSIAGNQDEMITTMEKQGVMLSAGIFAEGAEACLARMEGLLESLVSDAELREKLSQNAGALVDGRGAERIARAVRGL